MTATDPRRRLPSVDALLADPRAVAWGERFGRETVKRSVRGILEDLRAGQPRDLVDLQAWILESTEAALLAGARPTITPVLNGTGVVLHTNLGRAPLAAEAVEAQGGAAAYGDVEFSLETGKRGSRYDHCTRLLCELTGAESALITNNNAAAVSLCVNALADGRDVVVCRGELVEIGGSFRIPDVLARSGGRLREVGTTNRTRAADYEAVIHDETGILLRVHPSNYRVVGFTGRPELETLVDLARSHGIPLVHDVGSGLLDRDLLPSFPHEPTVRESVEAGVDLVTFSGDKLLGGPQAGLIVGASRQIEALRNNPLLRAFRVDKTTLAALDATLRLYRDPVLAARRIPTLRMLRESAAHVAERARRGLEAALGDTGIIEGIDVSLASTRSVVGGGSFPGLELESAGWRVAGEDAERLSEACRGAARPLIGRIEEDNFFVDVRTIAEGDEPEAASILLDCVRTAPSP